VGLKIALYSEDADFHRSPTAGLQQFLLVELAHVQTLHRFAQFF
jgi:hypothetical protein